MVAAATDGVAVSFQLDELLAEDIARVHLKHRGDISCLGAAGKTT
jgi:hypothetical protein